MQLKLTARILLISGLICLAIGSNKIARADYGNSVTFSISPSFFKVNINPGEVWSSSLKIINNNGYSVTVYAQVVDFKSGDTGGVEFIKSVDSPDADKVSLSRWISVSQNPFNIEAFGNVDIPFTINTPLNADPGGHYSAIIVGNEPVDQATGTGSKILISSKLAALILARISGNITEQGEIREFSTSKLFSKDLSTDFNIRFANSGNVHLHPQGEIKISNIFGQVRGSLPVNQKLDFGNILPNSTKKWEINWQGQSSVWDAGLMKAELSLSYGEEAKQSAVKSIYFWTVSLKPTLIVVSTILFFILFFIFLIKRYIRKSVYLMKEQAGLISKKKTSSKFFPPSAETNFSALKKTKASTGTKGLVINMRDVTSDSSHNDRNKN
jgi:hypothetical protein